MIPIKDIFCELLLIDKIIHKKTSIQLSLRHAAPSIPPDLSTNVLFPKLKKFPLSDDSSLLYVKPLVTTSRLFNFHRKQSNLSVLEDFYIRYFCKPEHKLEVIYFFESDCQMIVFVFPKLSSRTR